MKKAILFLFTILLITSCTTENSKLSAVPSTSVFSGYKITNSGANANNPSVTTSQTIILGNLQNDKFFQKLQN